MRGWFAAATLAGVLLSCTNADSFKTKCLGFKPEQYVYNSTRTQLEYVPAGTNLTFPDNDATCVSEQCFFSLAAVASLKIVTSDMQLSSFAHSTPTADFESHVQSRASQVVSSDLCRIALSIPTTKRSSITFELWLPRNWTGRFLATGNGGIDGCKLTSHSVTLDRAFAELSH